ncbi:N-acyl homoserine lactonase family protein [Amycolatopsis alkalitolerans]|uniref:N-acyl homoserine lactonase family protein n=1 Tax=Amycolatopsis alkalitolerans TaxID=2547244 RepID=A0A5C4M950_9PSEU|nr:N-acyl homoserine lactonase family protein [Amycolatopsis alkalitolerans]TNC27811.1 N-acyl homoserine lactonase family protein [Amycolatopsis alkalitolerans]
MTWEVLAVRFATRQTVASQVYLNYHVYGEPDRPLGMDYFFWVLRGPERTVLVDTGFTPAVGERRGRTMTCPVPEALDRLGIDPAAIEQVVITHAHYDHTGNIDLFPNAEILISARELDFWTGPYAGRVQFGHSAEPPDIAGIVQAGKEGRVTRLPKRHRLAPGIELREVGGHTPGQLVALVEAEGGTVVLASDAVHYYEEVELDRPFLVVADLEAMYRGFDELGALVAEPGTVLLAGHDPLVLQRFEPLEPGFAVRVGPLTERKG